MTEAALGRLDLPDEQAWLALSGNAALPGLVGADYQFCPGEETTTTEKIRLHLRGSRDQLNEWVNRLEAFQFQGEDLFLRLWSQERLEYGYAKIHQLTLETQPGYLVSKAKGSMELLLRVKRKALFFSNERPLPLSNSSGPPQENGLVLQNHDDSTIGHDNWFKVNAHELDMKYPPLTRFQFENNFSGPDLGNFWIGAMSTSLGQPAPKVNFEAESGSGGTAISHSQASGGKYCQFRWSGPGWQTLTSWVLGPVEVSQYGGNPALPILRFFTAPVYTSLQLRVLIRLQGKLVFEGPVTRPEPGKGYTCIDPISLPLGELPMKNYASPHELVLQAKQLSAGEHLLEVDDLLLLPQQCFAGYHFLGGLSFGSSLIDVNSAKKTGVCRKDLNLKVIPGLVAICGCQRTSRKPSGAFKPMLMARHRLTEPSG